MVFEKCGNGVLATFENEKVLLEVWGVDSLRVRSTKHAEFSEKLQALKKGAFDNGEIRISEEKAEICSGNLQGVLYQSGYMEFYKNGQLILKEYCRDFSKANEHSATLKVYPREYRAAGERDFEITVRFEANANERIYGMGQYQQSCLNLKGCVLELAQRNSQVSVPFYLSDRGYGFLWNNAGVGEVMFGENYTQWRAKLSEEMDYWITAGDTPKTILENYTAVTGRAPHFPENALGLWQCKLRYRTAQELLDVAREYQRRGIPLDVIVIDFYHWVHQGDWSLDPKYWPDPKAMSEELKRLGVRCMVSVWPTVEEGSCNRSECVQRGFLVSGDAGTVQAQEKVDFYDAFHPEARKFIWEMIKRNYLDNGIDMFWLDADEPEFQEYDFEHFRYVGGDALKITNAYSKIHTKVFYDGLQAAGKTDIVNLTRSAWAGSQAYAALVWSGDVKSNFTALKDQICAGLNIGIAGIPWWTTDIGGFMNDGLSEEEFRELLIRWYQFAAFSPVLRMHGDRGPSETPGMDKANELWSYGEEAYQIMRKYLDIRLGMKRYISSMMEEAAVNGSPVMRPMFYEFPEDPICWQMERQYMFGDTYLVAPVTDYGVREIAVYFPAGQWKDICTGNVYTGAAHTTVKAPLDTIPVFERL